MNNSNPLSNNNSKDDQSIMKYIFNRGVKKSRPQSADDLVNSCKSKIIINTTPIKSKKIVTKKYLKMKAPLWIRSFYNGGRHNQENHL